MKLVIVCVAVWCLVSGVQGRGPEDGRIIAARSRRTAIMLTTTTTIRPLTCALATTNVACQRRRYKSLRYVNLMEDNDDIQLDASKDQLEEVIESGGGGVGDRRDPRIALTVWTTTSSTFTITSTSINSAITFSLSFFCTVLGASFPPACG